LIINFDDIRRTKAFLGATLTTLFLHPFALALYAFVFLGLIALDTVRMSSRELLIGTAIFLGWLWILRRFIVDELVVSTGSIDGPETVAGEFSYHMIQHLMTKPGLTPATLLAAATESVRGGFVLEKLGLNQQTIMDAIVKTPITNSLEDVLGWMVQAKKDLETNRIDSTATIYAFMTHVQVLQELLNNADVSQEDLHAILHAEVFHFTIEELRRHRFSAESLIRTIGSIGRTWIMGYNTALEHLTKNLSEHILAREQYAIIHKKALESIEQAFGGGTSANLLILGSTGTGKRSLIRNLAFALRRREMDTSKAFTDVLLLKTALLLSGTQQSDKDLLKAFDDASMGGRFILVIEDTALLLKAADPRLKEILIRMLQSRNIRLACIADPSDYHTLIKTDPLIDSLFQKIYVEDADDAESTQVLLEEAFSLERTKKVRMTYRTLKNILELSKQYIGKGGLPGKAVEVLQSAVAATRGRGETMVTDDCVREVVSTITRIDVRALASKERDALLTLRERVREHIIGQEHAVESVVNALKRSRANIHKRTRPIGTFLFLGSTGVGKTETAKAFATEYFGSNESFIRVDMNELSNEDGIHTLIGGQSQKGFLEGFLTKRVQDRPFSLVLLDEIEKAHPKVLHVLLQMLDEGSLLDGNGIRTDFKNTIIIATSNAGSSWIKTHPTTNDPLLRDNYRTALIDAIVAEKTFSPEFINRFDEVIVFSMPTENEVRALAILMLDAIIKSAEKERGIRITVEADVIDVLVKKGFNPEFGAREMRRIITQTIENYLADYILSHEVKRGDEIAIYAKDVAGR
jgi:ATP-dependent Clp protease ATP-binding subunit ClpC